MGITDFFQLLETLMVMNKFKKVEDKMENFSRKLKSIKNLTAVFDSGQNGVDVFLFLLSTAEDMYYI